MDDIEELAARIVVALVASGQIPRTKTPLDIPNDAGLARMSEKELAELAERQVTKRKARELETDIANFYWRQVEALKEARPSARTGRAKRPSRRRFPKSSVMSLDTLNNRCKESTGCTHSLVMTCAARYCGG